MASSKVESGSVKVQVWGMNHSMNHSETLVRRPVTAVVAVGKPCGSNNHSETLVRAEPYYVPLPPRGNHSETLVRRPVTAVVAVGKPCGSYNHSETLVRAEGLAMNNHSETLVRR